MNRAVQAGHPADTSWRALVYFSLYRALIALLFVTLYWTGQLPPPLAIFSERLFAFASHGLLFWALLAFPLTTAKRPAYTTQVAAFVLGDIVLLTVMMHASGGLQSGFGMLLVIAVAGGGLLTPGRIGILYAAVASIMVLGHEIYAVFIYPYPPPNYPHAGFLGVTFFVTAIIGNVLAARVEQSRALAERSAQDLASLARLNELIVRRLESGVVVLDGSSRVRLMNEAAALLLGAGNGVGTELAQINPELAAAAARRRAGGGAEVTVVSNARLGVDIQASFSELPGERGGELLLILEDVSRLKQRAQQMKLASLGRLTASIAHEVRNPLGAISHAGQLLSESRTAQDEERRLLAIIEQQCGRVNRMIENILELSRRGKSAQAMIDLDAHVEQFAGEFRNRYGLQRGDVRLELDDGGVRVWMDPGQLDQVLWNLCDNARRYSTRSPLLTLRCGVLTQSQRAYVDVIDSGPGMSGDSEENLFEPFFTTESTGTGLGLYIARELCEANQATLVLYRNSDSGCCFRISFRQSELLHI